MVRNPFSSSPSPSKQSGIGETDEEEESEAEESEAPVALGLKGTVKIKEVIHVEGREGGQVQLSGQVFWNGESGTGQLSVEDPFQLGVQWESQSGTGGTFSLNPSSPSSSGALSHYQIPPISLQVLELPVEAEVRWKLESGRSSLLLDYTLAAGVTFLGPHITFLATVSDGHLIQGAPQSKPAGIWNGVRSMMLWKIPVPSGPTQESVQGRIIARFEGLGLNSEVHEDPKPIVLRFGLQGLLSGLTTQITNPHGMEESVDTCVEKETVTGRYYLYGTVI